MESRSFGSVRIFWLDKPKILACLHEAATHLAEARPEIAAVWLFGSLARGDAVPGSDADVLIVLDSSPKPFHERGVDYRLERCGVGVDVLVYTREEFERLPESSPRFYRTVLAEHLVLYERPASVR
jgi:predicted nucleotidyltransferase